MENEEIKIEYWFDKSQTVRKSIILYKMQEGKAWPVMYLTKPKWIDDDEFMELFRRMQIYIAS
jgi:hypothetical protein